MPKLQPSITNNAAAMTRIYYAQQKMKRAETSDIERDLQQQEKAASCNFDRETYNTFYGAPGDFPAMD